jgi:hypothetical protein
MSWMTHAILAGMLGLVLGCAAAAQPGPTPAPASQDDTCGVARYRHLIGRSIDAIDASTWPARSRVVCFGCMVTMDYVAERLTIQLDRDRKVASMRCG